jgi:hypothetical protein
VTDFTSDDALGRALTDLGAHVEVPAHSLWTRVAADLDHAVAWPRARGQWRVALVVACLLLVLLAATLAIAPARRAVADFLGIGSTRVERVDDTAGGAPPFDDVPAREDVAALRDELARADLGLPDLDLVGAPRAWRVDAAGTSVVVFDDVVLTQHRTEDPSLKRVAPSGVVTATTVGGASALWIEGLHTRTVDGRTYSSESALVWLDGDVELRLEGNLDLASVRRVAESVAPAD